jgi:PAS domain S-box-containing protein
MELYRSIRDLKLKFRAKSDEIRKGLVSAEVIEVDGQPGMPALTTDISERKRAETGLRESEERFRELFENASDILYTHDLAGNITSINKAAEQVTGYSRAEVLKLNISQIVVPEHLERARQMIQKKLEGKNAPLYELTILTKDGNRAEIELSTRLIFEGGKPVGVQGVARNISERKRAEKVRAAIYRISEATNSTQDLQALFRSIHAIVGELMSADNFYIALADRDIEEIRFPYFVDQHQQQPAPRKLGRGLTEYVLRTAQALHGSSELLEELQRRGEAELIGAWSEDWLGVPLKTQDKTIGALVVQSYTKGVRYGEEEKNILLFVSTQVAMAIERKQAEQDRAELLAREQAARNEAEHVNRLRADLLAQEQAARQEAEAARRQWQTTFDAMTDAVMLVGWDDRLIGANEAFYKMLGLAPEGSIGRTMKELIHDADEAKARACPLCRLRERGERGAVEIPAGVITDFPMLASLDPIIDPEGETIAYIQVLRDLSDLYKAREEADRERTSLNATIEQMAEGLIVFDESGHVVRANRHAHRIFGFTQSQMSLGETFAFVEGRFSGEDGRVIESSRMPVPTALDKQRIIDTRLWFAGPDGKNLLLAMTASPFFDDEGRLAGAILLTRDVTEQQREHERLQQADKLRALGQLASGVAHNFNNALAAVIGYTELAMPKVKDPDIRKYLRVVEQSARDAARMVERIQNFSRARARKDNFIPLRITDIVRDAIDITRPRWRNDAEALGIKYQVELGPQDGLDLNVNGEPSELREVFVNIILNALDAMPTGGSISIKASSQGQAVVLSFADLGGGMTEEIKRRVFEPFFTTKGVSGLGMGLSESYRIIERHGGRIDVESRLRQGTTFTIILPVIKLAEDEVGEEVDMKVLAASARILVIDDEEFVRNVITAILTEQGHKVTKVASAESALPLVERDEFEIVFTDLAMPKIDGITAATQIKALRPDIKVVLMSGYGADTASARVGKGIIDAAISKPFDMTEINQAIQKVMSAS